MRDRDPNQGRGTARSANRHYQNEWRRRKRAEDPGWRDRQRALQRDWAAAHIEHVRLRRRQWYAGHRATVRDYFLRRKFGITLADYAAQLLAQGNKCAICGTRRAGGRGGTFAVDHDHATRKWRGLLCQPCNTGLGHLRDSPVLIERARMYLEAHAWWRHVAVGRGHRRHARNE